MIELTFREKLSGRYRPAARKMRMLMPEMRKIMKKNVILIGMPGAGKSTIGVVLAKILGYQFLDTDLLIQQAEGKLLWQIIEEKGVEEFIRIEEQINCGVDVSQSVISPGGSVVYGDKAMEHFRRIGTVVYLDVDCDLLEKRVGNFERRGVVQRLGNTFRSIYDERLPLYQKYAHITVHEDGDDLSQTVSDILAALDVVRETGKQNLETY